MATKGGCGDRLVESGGLVRSGGLVGSGGLNGSGGLVGIGACLDVSGLAARCERRLRRGERRLRASLGAAPALS